MCAHGCHRCSIPLRDSASLLRPQVRFVATHDYRNVTLNRFLWRTTLKNRGVVVRICIWKWEEYDNKTVLRKQTREWGDYVYIKINNKSKTSFLYWRIEKIFHNIICAFVTRVWEKHYFFEKKMTVNPINSKDYIIPSIQKFSDLFIMFVHRLKRLAYKRIVKHINRLRIV